MQGFSLACQSTDQHCSGLMIGFVVEKMVMLVKKIFRKKKEL